MNILVPLASPCYCTDSFIKGLLPSPHDPLLFTALKSRPWSNHRSVCYTFILLDNAISRDFYKQYILDWFPNSKAVFLSEPTNGAALSVVSGISLSKINSTEPIIIDLADFTFSCDREFSIEGLSQAAYAFTFISDQPNYSYFTSNASNKILMAAEKKVISSKASVGVYFFQSSALYLSLVSMALLKPTKFTYKDMLYVSPLFNLLEKNQFLQSDGYLIDVYNVTDLSMTYYV